MQRRDRGLQRERTGPAAQRGFDQRQRFGDLLLVPARAILLFEHDEIAGGVGPRVAPRIVQQHQRHERGGFRRRRRHQRSHQPPQTDRLGRDVRPHERPAPRRRVAFVEDQIDHGQHRVEPRRHVVGVGHHVRDARVANFPFRPHQPLGHRRGRNEKRARDFVGLEPAQRPKRQRDLGVERQGRMAAGEDQSQPIVRDLARVVVGFLDGPVEPRRPVCVERLGRLLPPPEAVDGLVAGRLDDPGARKLGHPRVAPLVNGGGKCFLGRLFGQIEVAQEPDERRHDPAPIRPVNGVDRGRGVLDSLGHSRW